MSGHEKEKEVGAAAVGGGTAQGAYQGAGYGTKHFVDARTRKGGARVTPAQVKLQDKALKANKKTFGMHLPKGSAARDNAGYHRAYPTDLPHGRTIRALGHTHEGRLGVVVGAATTLAGGTAAAAAAHHHLKKSATAQITGALWKAPTHGSEFRRAFRGSLRGHMRADTYKGGLFEHHVHDTYKAKVAGEKRHSPHKGSFGAGVKTGHAVATAAEHPEVTIPVAAGAAATPLIVHRTHKKKKKGEPVTKSAFGVEHISKYQAGTITYHQHEADLHSRKKASGYRQAAVGAAAATGGVAAHVNSEHLGRELAGRTATPRNTPNLHELGTRGSRYARKIRQGGAGLAVAGGALATVGIGRAVHHGRKQNKQAKQAQAARRDRNAEAAAKEDVGKSAFGVEKGIVGDALKIGQDAVHGMRSGLGAKGVATSTAGRAGAKAGGYAAAGVKKVTPLVNTKAKAAAAAGGGGLLGGALLTRNNNS